MFLNFQPIRGPILREKVNTMLGSLLLAVVGLWASMFIWNVANGSNPIDEAFQGAVVQTILIASH